MSEVEDIDLNQPELSHDSTKGRGYPDVSSVSRLTANK